MPDLCRHGLLNTLSDMYSLSNDREIIRASAKILDNICKNGILIDLVYKIIKFNDLVANMNVNKDLATAKYSFHIAKTFSKY